MEIEGVGPHEGEAENLSSSWINLTRNTRNEAQTKEQCKLNY